MDIPDWLYTWIAIIAFIKVINVVSGYIVQRKFMAAHIDIKYSAIVICIVATFAAVQEGYYIRTEGKS